MIFRGKQETLAALDEKPLYTPNQIMQWGKSPQSDFGFHILRQQRTQIAFPLIDSSI